MFCRKSCLLMVILFFFTFLSSAALAETNEWRLIHGDVVQILSQENKIMLETNGTILIFALEPECHIFRNGFPAAFESLRPITYVDFQDALCWINPRGLISCILANYSVHEEGGILINRDIFGNVK